MSLDVYLYTRDVDGNEFLAYDRNITHNMGRMADAAGLYKALWRPEEMNPPSTVARQLIPALRAGVTELALNRETYLPLNPENGWGSYDLLLSFSQTYLAACEKFPSARIEISR